MKKRTCDELGLCQARTPRCSGCTEFPFAPGVIDAGPNDQGRRWLPTDLAGALALVALAYFLAGWLQ